MPLLVLIIAYLKDVLQFISNLPVIGTLATTLQHTLQYDSKSSSGHHQSTTAHQSTDTTTNTMKPISNTESL